MNFIFIILCFSSLLLEGSSVRKMDFKCTGMLSKTSAAVNENDQLVCSCTNNFDSRTVDDMFMTWSFVQGSISNGSTVITEVLNDNKTISYTKKNASVGSAGYYSCMSKQNPSSFSTIYVWVKSKKFLFASPELIVTSKRDHYYLVKVPCIPSSPCYNVKLFKGSQEIKVHEPTGVKFDPREGFIIEDPAHTHVPISFTCSITMYGHTENVTYNYPEYIEKPRWY